MTSVKRLGRTRRRTPLSLSEVEHDAALLSHLMERVQELKQDFNDIEFENGNLNWNHVPSAFFKLISIEETLQRGIDWTNTLIDTKKQKVGRTEPTLEMSNN